MLYKRKHKTNVAIALMLIVSSIISMILGLEILSINE